MFVLYIKVELVSCLLLYFFVPLYVISITLTVTTFQSAPRCIVADTLHAVILFRYIENWRSVWFLIVCFFANCKNNSAMNSELKIYTWNLLKLFMMPFPALLTSPVNSYKFNYSLARFSVEFAEITSRTHFRQPWK